MTEWIAQQFTLSVALIADLTILPAQLMLLYRNRRPRADIASPERSSVENRAAGG